MTKDEIEAQTSVVSRRMNVAARHIFAAFSTAEHISRWFGPVDYPVTHCEYDFRVGGRWRMAMTGPDGLRGPYFGGRFLEIEPVSRIVFTNAFEDGVGGGMGLKHADEMVMTATILPEADGTTTVSISTLFANPAMMKEYLSVGMVEGQSSGLDQLAVVATELAAIG